MFLDGSTRADDVWEGGSGNILSPAHAVQRCLCLVIASTLMLCMRNGFGVKEMATDFEE